MHIVVRKNIGIETITDLKNRKIFIGAEGSGTRVVVTQILEAIGLSEGSYMADGAGSFTDAADKLVGEELEAAFFAAGTPTEAVQKALESGEAELLTLDGDTRRQITTSHVDLALEEVEIPANFYPNQPERVESMGADVFLVCRRDLPEDLAFLILDALFDNIADLRLAHAKAQGIKLTRAFEVPGGFLMRVGDDHVGVVARLVPEGIVRENWRSPDISVWADPMEEEIHRTEAADAGHDLDALQGIEL